LFTRNSAALVASENEFSLTRLLNFRSFIRIFELKLQYFLMGGKPHSFGEINLPPSQTTLFRVVAVKNTEASFVFLARLFKFA
jgi:hypothetical protein